MSIPAQLSLVTRALGRLAVFLLAAGGPLTGWSGTIAVTNTANTGPGSFQQALLTANANPGLDTIVFQISGTPPFTIAPTTALPAITDPVVIDATTQPGFAGKPVIELNGAATVGLGQVVGLKFSSGASTLRGMAINRFPVQLIELDSASNNIQGNFLGTDVTGTVARGSGTGSPGLGNLNDGIVIYGSSSNVIGGATAAAQNVISGNGASGIYLTGSASTGNRIQGNRIGTDISGSSIVGNTAGDGITLISAPGNLISGNLISGNGLSGVSITNAAGNMLLGNFIGTDVNGQTNLGNHFAGVTISGTGGSQIGGPNAGNVVSGNLLDGIALTGGTTTNVIQGNLIGVSAAGTNALHNGHNGISISGSISNLVGGTISGARNIISGNAYNGVGILLLTDRGNAVQGNYIGTDITGAKAIANTLAGVRLQASTNLIGGTAAGAGNVISGNGVQGIYITNGCAANLVQGNIIGLDVSSTKNLGNGDAGVGIVSSSGNQVGGSAAGARNIISANAGEAIFVLSAAANNIIQGNYLGTDGTGMVGHPNTYEGITVQSANNTQIGGTASGAGNLISANNNRGIYLLDAYQNIIQGNFIGTKADGVSALANFYHDVDIDVGSSNNIVGGTAAGAGNHLAFASIGASSVYCGVRIRTGAYNNLISGNSIFNNGALGIDLSPTIGGNSPGVNAIVDCESGIVAGAANAGQNFPVLTTTYSGATTRVRGTMDGKTGNAYTLQFFASPAGNALGYGEGQVYLGQTNITLGATCSTNFTAYVPGTVAAGWVVTATATDASNNTSEFSAWVPAILVPPVQLAWAGPTQLTLSWTNNGGSFSLEQALSLSPPVNWSAVTNLPVLQNNFMVATVGVTNSSVFYRLSAP